MEMVFPLTDFFLWFYIPVSEKDHCNVLQCSASSRVSAESPPMPIFCLASLKVDWVRAWQVILPRLLIRNFSMSPPALPVWGMRSQPKKVQGSLLQENLCFCMSPARICKMDTGGHNLCSCNGHSSTEFHEISCIYVSKKFGSGWILPLEAGAVETESSVDFKPTYRDCGYCRAWFAHHRYVTS